MKAFLHKHGALLSAVVVALLFVVLYAVDMVRNDSFLMLLLPAAAVVLWLAVARLEYALLAVALLTPFSINLDLFDGMELSLPAEPLMILCMGVVLFRLLLQRGYDRRLLRHPVTMILMGMLAWMAVTSATSVLPTVAFKRTLSQLWFIVPFYFAAARIFQDRKRIRQFYWAYALGLAVVVAITTAKTLGNFSDLQTLHRVMRPFYNDHTAYGCVLALFLPIGVHLLLSRDGGLWKRIAALALVALFGTGLFLSYCRAAWISIVAALGVYLLVRMGMKLKWMVALFGLGVGLFFVHQGDVLYKLGKNRQDSSYTLADQVKSISNISTDASNLERLNRWASAFRMWGERPLFGTGPGTYQFLYGSYQKSYQLSTISTNAGDLGNAHSEYIGPLTEQGVPGAALVIALFLATFATGVRVYRTAQDPAVGRLALALALALLTYYVHGVFNNFLDTDKLSVPFWAFTAAVVALDVYSEKKDGSLVAGVADEAAVGTESIGAGEKA
ncbi:MAG: O-antigen ligase family protein [Bacteroidales bacterium]|nr:O-antigen ligase family protein [Bacteroidales bacterium]